jgi:alpha-D-ribose 1-methylphosphonate 5-triphosphate synthase subunit PhnG
MAVLARASKVELERYYRETYEDCSSGETPDQTGPSFDIVRAAETGLMQVRARAGGTGNQFNLGEMTLTRCVVQSQSGFLGYAYVAGRDKSHALLAAKFDALLQDEQHQVALLTTLIEPLSRHQIRQRAEKAAATESTRVDFFTLVRGED